MSADLALYGRDLFGEAIAEPSRGPLADAFLVPPFTVLNAREGWWQERKRAWLSRGIESEIGREARAFSCNDGQQKKYDYLPDISTGTSIFDPVLCELSYRWFCPSGGQVVDPFAGGSVRGIVAGLLGYRYQGIDLRQEQIDANRKQAIDIFGDTVPVSTYPQWICGDAFALLPSAPPADFIFTCPPYGDLERYSDDPRDLSTLPFLDFVRAYRDIIARAAALLKPDRFACFVVGDYRNKAGNYSNFPAITIKAFHDAGMPLYNEAILVSPAGSLPVRAKAPFSVSRKLGKTHQNMLVFIKGDARRAAEACGEVQTYGDEGVHD